LCETLVPPPKKKMSLKITCVEFKVGETFFCFEVVRVENGRGGASPSLPPPLCLHPCQDKESSTEHDMRSEKKSITSILSANLIPELL